MSVQSPGLWRRLTSDPPMLDRVLWRERLERSTMISADRGLMARAFGSLSVLAATIAFVRLLVGTASDQHPWVIGAVATLGWLVGLACFVIYRRLPKWVFQAMLVAGTVTVTGMMIATTEGAEGVVALYYVWIVLLAALFFTVRATAAHVLFAALFFSAVLMARDADFRIGYALSAAAVMATTATIVVLLRTRLERLAAELASEAHTDPVTKVSNRRGFNQRLDLEIVGAERSGSKLSLIVCDLDRFKSVNDTLGHDKGDLALQEAAEAIAASVRRLDAVGRLGGEEFGVMVPGADEAMVREVADRIRDGIRGAFVGHPIDLTGSCGTATLGEDGADRLALMRAADDALYLAKRRGRDRTESASELRAMQRDQISDASSTK